MVTREIKTAGNAYVTVKEKDEKLKTIPTSYSLEPLAYFSSGLMGSMLIVIGYIVSYKLRKMAKYKCTNFLRG